MCVFVCANFERSIKHLISQTWCGWLARRGSLKKKNKKDNAIKYVINA